MIIACLLILAFASWTYAVADNSSDFVGIYYNQYCGQASHDLSSESGAGSLTNSQKDYRGGIQLDQDVSAEIAVKLQPFGLNFDGLPQVLQRAVMWDSGYVSADNGSLAKIYTRCNSNNSGVSMVDLALETKLVKNVGCEVRQCARDNDSTAAWSFSSDCGPGHLDSIVQCASTSVKTIADEIPVWATSGFQNSGDVPDLQIRRHVWSNTSGGRSAIFYSIHTAEGLQVPSRTGTKITSSQMCASQLTPSLLAIPCIELKVSDPRWCRPESSALMSKWLSEYSSSSHNGSLGFSSSSASTELDDYHSNSEPRTLSNTNTQGKWRQTVPVLMVGGACLVVTAIAVFIYLKRRSRQLQEEKLQSWGNQRDSQSSDLNTTLRLGDNSPVDREDIFGNPHSAHSLLMLSTFHLPTPSPPSSRTPTPESTAVDSPNHILAGADEMDVLARDAQLKHARLPFDSLQFHHLIARGTHCEVWFCVLRDQCVAVKRLPKTQSTDMTEIKAFIRTIRLSAPLQHSNILGFVGVAWTSLHNLCLVTEYMELGDLQEYLRRTDPEEDHNQEFVEFLSLSMSWRREKLQLALGIARGLVYLHRHNIIHRNLKAKNVLLSAALDAKLKGFGVNSSGADNSLSQTKTAADSTFWTAPEVLAGEAYSEKSDIYSLGVVLTELDTHKLPYTNVVTARGQRMPPILKLQHILSGELKLSCSPKCPSEIVHLVEWCLHRDPAHRPSSKEVMQDLNGMSGAMLDVFSF